MDKMVDHTVKNMVLLWHPGVLSRLFKFYLNRWQSMLWWHRIFNSALNLTSITEQISNINKLLTASDI